MVRHSGIFILLLLVLWTVAITSLHGFLNLGWGTPANTAAELRIGFLPVTCHLTCPVTDFLRKQDGTGSLYEPIRFSGWPELKEAFLSGHTEATFILAPLAMALREQGIPIKIVHLGHRDGTAVVVHQDSDIRDFAGLRGKTIAIPNRFSNQHILVYRALRDAGVPLSAVRIVEMPPPDMPAALYARAVDAICSGEPFMGQAELDGYGRVLGLTKDIWPGFISCVLAVHEDLIATNRPLVAELVRGIHASGRWIDSGSASRAEAAEFVATQYYNQDPRLLRFVLSKPPDRVTYSRLNLLRDEFAEIEKLGAEIGILEGTAHFEDYTDTSFNEELETP